MNETIALSMNYNTRSSGTDLENDTMLFALGLEMEAKKQNVRLACNSKPGERRLDVVLSGTSEGLERFLGKLRSENIDYSSVNDYQVGASTPYRGREPDWEYHNSLVAMRSAYLRTAYMTDVRHLLEKLADHPKLRKISA